MNFYGVPMQESTKGLATLFNYLGDENSTASEWILLDEELTAILYKHAKMEEDRYKEMAEKITEEFKIEKLQPSTLASWFDFAVNAIGVGISKALEFGNQLLYNLCKNAGEGLGAVVGGVTGGLFSNSGGFILLLAGIILLMIFM